MAKLLSVSTVLIICVLVAATPARAVWVENGVRICMEPEFQVAPQIFSDEAGGAIIVWVDGRTAISGFAIYAQRINAQGDNLWIAEGVRICSGTGTDRVPVAIPDGAGGVILAWSDRRTVDYNILAQRIDADGTVLWAEDGMSICSATGDQAYPGMVSDGAGGAIIVWSDRRSGPDTENSDIYAQRVTAAGTVQWTVDGIGVCVEAEYQYGPCMAVDGAGGAIVIWTDGRSGVGSDLYAQRIDAAGAAQWAAGGVPFCTFGTDQYHTELLPDGAGGAIGVWMDARGSGSGSQRNDLYSQRIDGTGAILWNADGVPVCTAEFSQAEQKIVTDGSGGAIVTWMDSRSGFYDVYVQRINASGIVEWAANGVAVCALDGLQWVPAIMPLLGGGAMITWWDNRNSDDITSHQSPRDIYVQRIDGFGSPLWAAEGVLICDDPGDQLYSQLATDGMGGTFITWHDWRVEDPHIYAFRINASGEGPVACELQNWSTGFLEDRVSIEWSLSEVPENPEFVINRMVSGGGTRDLSSDVERTGDLTYSCIDRSVESGSTYYYTIGIKEDGRLRVLFESGPVDVPVMPARLSQNYPNPFNPATTISYYLPAACHARLAVYDAAGRIVATLVDGEQESGHYSLSWNGLENSGDAAVSGVYFYKLFAGKETLASKMVLLR